ncbi:hypothetical protein EIP91_012069 [Steccherinum ochraceum]|uniref:Exonuclease V, mitochondrial n=1 Tax=Steccherinum ochraceum TaxID=92696 RepID=A0A4R0RQS4_9APHY|nr:hypothetical protein EIP91_012069 [Steccherinum ochraceum]
MSEDEYDRINLSFDIEDLPFISSLPPSPPTSGRPSQESRPSEEEQPEQPVEEESQESQSSDLDVYYTAPSTQLDAHQSDSYSDYDLSEFTAEDLASIDASIAGSSSSTSTMKRPSIVVQAAKSLSGPTVSVVLEGASKSLSSMAPPAEPAVHKTKAQGSTRPKSKELSPFERFRSWRGMFSVTDLTSPSWCEVQFDYGLRQKRYLKVEERPKEFKSATGKTIVADQSVAVSNDKVTQRGKSVHKILERELHPEAVPVETTTDEERWALRPSKSSAPTTPTKPKAKKARRSLSPDQLPLTTFFPSTPSRSDSQADLSSSPIVEDKGIQVSSPPHESNLIISPTPPDPPPLPSTSQFKLHLSDTKTRKNPTIPPYADIFPAKMQLMLYHRLLSNLIASPSESEDALDFQYLWTRMSLDHRRPFSQKFRDSAGLTLGDGNLFSMNCLDDITNAWRNAVDALHIAGVDDTLTVVYRTQPRKSPRKGKRRDENRKPKHDILEQEETADVVRAVIASLGDEIAIKCNQKMVEGSLKTLLAEATPASATVADPVTDAERDDGGGDGDPDLQWAIQQSLLVQLRQRPELKNAVLSGGAVSTPPSPKGKSSSGDETETDEADAPTPQSTIIGKKTFEMDEKTLSSYLVSVLDWWHGRRPPKGVDLHLTRRCMSCEYQEGCAKTISVATTVTCAAAPMFPLSVV